MRGNGIFRKRKRKFRPTTDPNHNHPVADNLLNREFVVDKPMGMNLRTIIRVEFAIQSKQQGSNRRYITALYRTWFVLFSIEDMPQQTAFSGCPASTIFQHYVNGNCYNDDGPDDYSLPVRVNGK